MKAEIVEVASMDSYNSSRSCSGKVTEVKKGVRECTKCHCKIKISKSKQQNVARVVLEDEGGKEYKVTMCGEMIQTIVQMSNKEVATDEDLELSESLLMSPQLTYTVNVKKETVSFVSL